MSRPNTLSDGSQQVVSGVTYGPAGELLSVAGFYTETRSYNTRLQLTGLNGATFTYASGTANNGQIQTETVSGETITYQYDALNRLMSSTSNQGWSQGYNYDGYGNLTAKTALAGSVPTFTAAYDLNNRQVGFTYDANGNQLSDPAGVVTSGYDVENRLAWGTRSGSLAANGYGYDPDNRRVYLSKWMWNPDAGEWRLSGGGYEEVIYYGVGGQKMGTYRLAADASGMYLTAVGYNVYFGSKLVRKVAADGTATIVRADRLGSFGRFHAYGQERGTAPPENTEKFATYYRDADTGLDYAANRYYSSEWGRFLTPDPYKSNSGGQGDVGDPASWNRYGYVGGDPANWIDPSGSQRWAVSAWGRIYCLNKEGGSVLCGFWNVSFIYDDGENAGGGGGGSTAMSEGKALALTGLRLIGSASFRSKQGCRDLFQQLIKGNNLDLSVDQLMDEVVKAANTAADHEYIYDGLSSNDTLDSIRFPGADTNGASTIGQWFGQNPLREAL